MGIKINFYNTTDPYQLNKISEQQGTKRLKKVNVQLDTFYINSDRICIATYESKKRTDPFLLLINLHNNERTSIAAAQRYIRENGGKFIRPLQILPNSLRETYQRYIQLSHKANPIQLDPNRCFSNNDPSFLKYTKESRKYIVQLKEHLVKHINELNNVIAVHNNHSKGYYSDPYQDLSIEFYKDLPFIKELAISKDPDQNKSNPKNFFYVNRPYMFSYLKGKGYNVVLQDDTKYDKYDDGSLSWHCAKKNIPYINIEVEAQQKMVDPKAVDIQLQMIKDAAFIMKWPIFY